MRTRKPAGWPDYMRAKQLKVGGVAYYWSIPTWAVKRGCLIRAEALGTEYSLAKQRCDDVLNRQFDAWRLNGASEGQSVALGTFDWMVAIYKTSPKYQLRPVKTRKSIDAALALTSKHRLKDGRLFGALNLSSITPGVADKLFQRLSEKPSGGLRVRTALLSMQYCRRAWFVARRDKPNIVPLDNPFARMEIKYQANTTRPVSHDELSRFVKAADSVGEASIGTAAMIAYYWLQREIDVLTRFTWNQYRPSDATTFARIYHHKTGELMDLPLFDDDGTVLWPS